MGKIHRNSEQAISALIECLHNDDDWVVREKAAKALGRVEKTNKVINALIKALQTDVHGFFFFKKKYRVHFFFSLKHY